MQGRIAAANQTRGWFLSGLHGWRRAATPALGLD